MSDCDLLSVSSDRDVACTAPASCSDPKRALGLLGAVRCDPRPLPGLLSLPQDTSRKEDEAAGTSCSPVSTSRCIHAWQRTGSPPGALPCASRSTSVLVPPAPCSLYACTGPLVCMASLHLHSKLGGYRLINHSHLIGANYSTDVSTQCLLIDRGNLLSQNGRW